MIKLSKHILQLFGHPVYFTLISDIFHCAATFIKIRSHQNLRKFSIANILAVNIGNQNVMLLLLQNVLLYFDF